MSCIDNKKVLVTGGSHSEIPLIEALHKMGYYVITTGNNQDGWGHAEGDEYIRGDYSDADFVLSVARDKRVCGIVSGCNDFAYMSTVYACEQLELPGHDLVEKGRAIHHKDLFRQKQKELGIRCPKFMVFRSTDDITSVFENTGFPCMVKPVDLTGGKGIKKCDNEYELIRTVDDAFAWTREDHIIIEEYVKGENHGFTCLLKNERVIFSFLDDEQYYRNPYLVSGACGPSNRIDVVDKLINDIETIAANLKLADGLFHVQIIVDSSGYPVMIDPCRRSPGDMYISFVRYSTGVDYAGQIVNAELGLGLSESYDIKQDHIARECIMATREGIFKKVSISEEIKEFIIDSIIWSRPGDNYANSMTYKAGILFLKFDMYEQMRETVDRFHDLVRIEYYN